MSFPETRLWRLNPVAVAMMVVCLVGTGCTREPYQTAAVTGRITIAGRPVPGILVMFAPPGGSAKGLPPAYGLTDADGRYRVMRPKARPGAVVGPTDVTLSLADGAFDRPPGVSANRLAKQQLSFDVKPGGNAFDIVLDE